MVREDGEGKFSITAAQDDWVDVHIALVERILSGDGFCFHNNDPGHATYRFGAAGRLDAHGSDGPEVNATFQLLLKTTKVIGTSHYNKRYRPIASWKDFCVLALEGYESKLKASGY